MPARIAALLAVILLLAPVSVRAAETLSDGDRAAIRQVIQGQLDAFKRGDGAAAYGLASPEIQLKFGTAENFMNMVKAAYPAVYRPKAVEFRELDSNDAMGVVQKVFFIGPDGSGVLAYYPMERQPDGSWKINGCFVTVVPDTSV
jgi:Domain of unknown function (DUF4864)